MATPWMIYGQTMLSALVAAVLVTPLVRRLACRLGIVDLPGGRKAHAQPTALLGGVAVLVAAAVGVAVAAAGVHATGAGAARVVAAVRLRATAPGLATSGLLGGASLVVVAGLVDDRWKDRFPWWAKLLAQVTAAAVAVLTGSHTDLFVVPVLNLAISALWIVAMTNAMNFLDHADGVCAGVGGIGAALLAAVAVGLDQPAIAVALLALSGALFGFLRWNFPPARIFLGDAGSQSVGFLLATLSLRAAYVAPHSPGTLPALLPLFVLGVPLFDLLVVLSARLREGRPLHRADRNHLHHRLRRLGMSARQATGAVYLAAVSLGAGALALPVATWPAAIAILVQAAATMGLIAALMLFGERGAAP